jgi:hypothetical protein
MSAFEDTRLEALARGAGAGITEAPGDRRSEVVGPDQNDLIVLVAKGDRINGDLR